MEPCPTSGIVYSFVSQPACLWWLWFSSLQFDSPVTNLEARPGFCGEKPERKHLGEFLFGQVLKRRRESLQIPPAHCLMENLEILWWMEGSLFKSNLDKEACFFFFHPKPCLGGELGKLARYWVFLLGLYVGKGACSV